jgi:hypothetical protein
LLCDEDAGSADVSTVADRRAARRSFIFSRKLSFLPDDDESLGDDDDDDDDLFDGVDEDGSGATLSQSWSSSSSAATLPNGTATVGFFVAS